MNPADRHLREEIVFRPLQLDELGDLHLWLNRPHLRRFFQKKAISKAEVESKYGPAIRGEILSHSHLAYFDGRPFAYLQCYGIADWPEWATLVESQSGIGVDLAIFEPDMLGRGFGRAMLSAYLRNIAFPLFPAEQRCFIAHETGNDAAIACSKAAGFRYLRNFREDDFENALFVLERDNSAAGRG